MTYYIDPGKGNDSQSGTEEGKPWRTFVPLSKLLLAPGDRVEILGPGEFRETLAPAGTGTPGKPIVIRFAAGRYDFYPDGATKRKLQISNTNDAWDKEKAIAICFRQASHFRVVGPDAFLVMRGKMVDVAIEESSNIEFEGLHFDYHRPTVSEYSVLSVDKSQAEIRIHPDSAYEIRNGRLVWVGEGWEYGSGLTQELDVELGEIWRREDPLKGLSAEETGPFRVRVHFDRNPGLTAGRVYQLRDTYRDCAGVFVSRSGNITWRKTAFHFLHGLGVVSQFSENLVFDKVAVAPRKESGRTCAAWADCLHFSGCRGKISIVDSVFSGTHDDPVNVHGTHLRIVGTPGADQVKVAFMHPQTFGFEAFAAGDEIEFVRCNTLNPYSSNRVVKAGMVDNRNMLLTLEKPVPGDVRPNDVIENVTWTPEVEIRGCRVALIPTRGFLLTTRGKIVVENNDFIRTYMSAILIADDARSWFESGYVRDVVIRGNRFVNCADPVIQIDPENSAKDKPVHENIRIEDNDFLMRGKEAVFARSTKGLVVSGNRIRVPAGMLSEQFIRLEDCLNVTIDRNEIVAAPQGASGRQVQRL